MDGKKIEALQHIISESEYIVFFGGAGVSTESGIPDFRSVDGLYHLSYRYPPETILSRAFFQRSTEEFYRFYREKMIYREALPNMAHRRLAELEQSGRLRAVITQNIDGLHQAAGSRQVLELHGSVHRNHCVNCRACYDLDFILRSEGVPRCPVCGGVVKPDVVLYGEPLDEKVLRASADHLRRADAVIVGGTSLNVYPAAGLLDAYRGDRLVLINRDATHMDADAALVLQENIGEVFGRLHV